jgi:hypothetical protein
MTEGYRYALLEECLESLLIEALPSLLGTSPLIYLMAPQTDTNS